jgi:membrane-associated phospholipid phosphatase
MRIKSAALAVATALLAAGAVAPASGASATASTGTGGPTAPDQPSTANTGVNPGVSLVSAPGGSQRMSGVTLANRVITGDVTFYGSNLVLRNVRVTGEAIFHGDNLVIEDSEFGSLSLAGTVGVQVSRVEVFGKSGKDGIHITSGSSPASDVVVEDSLLHNPSQLQLSDAVHVRGVERLRIANVVMDVGPFKPGTNSGLFLERANGGNHSVVVEDSWILGGGYTVYAFGTDMRIRRSVIGAPRWGLLYPESEAHNITDFSGNTSTAGVPLVLGTSSTGRPKIVEGAFPVPHPIGGTATVGTVDFWNDVLLEAFRRQGGAPTIAPRAAAMMHVAIHDTLNAAHWHRTGGVGELWQGYLQGDLQSPAYPGLRMFVTTARVDDDLAASLAARDALSIALPEQADYVRREFTGRYGTRSQAAATSLATRVVNALRADRDRDGAAAVTPYTPDGVPGAWRPTGNGCTTAVTPHWGAVRRFYAAPPRPALPGGYSSYAALLGSPLYAEQVAQVRSLGARNSTTRTADQTAAAFFWAHDLPGTFKPPGHLLSIAADIVADEGWTDPVAVARLFAHLSMGLSDAAVSAWDAKYRSPIDLWRPESAIRLAATDGNPATTPDPAWAPLSKYVDGTSFSPCFPAWISGHSTFAGAWAEIMQWYFGEDHAFTAGTEDPHAVGQRRSFGSFHEAAVENARSRVYLGVHYAFDADDGLAAGYAVGSTAGPFRPAPCGAPSQPCLPSAGG